MIPDMKYNNLNFKLRGSQSGLCLFDGDQYLATYRSANDCLMDLAYHFRVDEFEKIIQAFGGRIFGDREVLEPFEYRGVCSELFWPTDIICRYVYYEHTLTALLEKFAFHEERAKRCEHFEFGVQGSGIHLFNKQTLKYEFWIGGEFKSVADIVNSLRAEGKLIPSSLEKEYKELNPNVGYDVFISHSGQDLLYAKKVYDFLSSNGFRVFLSEVSLPYLANTDYAAVISEILEQTENMVVIANDISKLDSGWVKYEWSSYLNEKHSGRKKGNLATILIGDTCVEKLPYALRQYEAMRIDAITPLTSFFSIS